MKLKLQADADLNERIVRGILRRDPSIDLWTAHQGGLIGLPDPEVLRIAAESKRLLISQDQNTMPRHFREFLREASSPGVLIVRQSVPIGVAIEAVCTIAGASEAEEWRDVLKYLQF